MAYIDVIEPEQAERKLKQIYEKLEKERGKLAGIHKIQSLHPDTITYHMDLYMELMFGKSPLKRYQREMLGVVVSAINNCDYCIQHHAEALNHYWKDRTKVDQLADDFRQCDLDERDKLLCRYAEQLTRKPHEVEESQIIRDLKTQLTDRALLDANLIVSYFNFVNRIVLGLGVEYDAEEVKGYKY